MPAFTLRETTDLPLSVRPFSADRILRHSWPVVSERIKADLPPTDLSANRSIARMICLYPHQMRTPKVIFK